MLLSFQDKTGVAEQSVTLRNLVIAGWTGRDAAALEKHIVELEQLGVPRPSRTPIFYLASASRPTTADSIEVLGEQTSGEAEYLLLQYNGVLWVGIGSDHTDRDLEVHGVALSKQICEKPIGTHFWRYDEVAPHWDALRLRSYATIAGAKVVYQDDSVAKMLDPIRLISLYAADGRLPESTLMFCGTVPVHGGIRPASRFECELEDPVIGRRIRKAYDIKPLPLVS